MRYPATRWQDATPTGSGVVGAMVYGRVKSEAILLNHDALYYPTDKPPIVDVSDQFPTMRALVRSGHYRDAAQVLPQAYTDRTGKESSVRVAPYQPLGVINIEAAPDIPFRNYRRGVDFETGRAWVEWRTDAGAYTREVFVSRQSDLVYVRLRSSTPGAVTCTISLEKPVDEQSGVGYFGRENEVSFDVSQQVSLDDRTLSFVGRYPGTMHFGARARWDVSGGQVTSAGDAIHVSGADEVVLRVRLFVDEPPDTAAARLSEVLASEPADFDAALAAHAKVHRELFTRMTLDFDAPPRESNEQMLMQAYDGDVPLGLIQTLFEYGRYLLICSSRAGGWPANLQGVWNGDYVPAWASDIHVDENIQMNYWQALPGAMPETALPLFDYFERHIDDFRSNARNTHGCRGILVPLAMTTHGLHPPSSYSSWTAAAGWIGQHFYDSYLFTGDLGFLRDRAVPWLKEVALYYEDFLQSGEDGGLLFVPSVSPENRPSNCNSMQTMNATMDVAVCREVLTNLCDACEELGIEPEGVARWRAMLRRLPEYQVNADGALREWLHPAFDDNYHHRHQSHLYPVFPGLEVTEESDPALFEACRIAVEKRLVIGLTSQTGWSMAHMANIYARLGEGDRARECLDILTRSSTGANLLTYHNDWRQMGLSMPGNKGHPPFQIDANFGFTAAVLEMLVYSKPGLIKLLPSLPSTWNAGQSRGIACRGGVSVDVTWNQSAGTLAATFLSRTDQTVRVHFPAFASPTPSDRLIAVRLSANTQVEISR